MLNEPVIVPLAPIENEFSVPIAEPSCSVMTSSESVLVSEVIESKSSVTASGVSAPVLVRFTSIVVPVLARIFPDDFEILDEREVRFSCPCSRERFEAAIVTLGDAEIQRIIEEEEKDYTEVVCHFCNEAYHFSPEEMKEILRKAS